MRSEFKNGRRAVKFLLLNVNVLLRALLHLKNKTTAHAYFTCVCACFTSVNQPLDTEHFGKQEIMYIFCKLSCLKYTYNKINKKRKKNRIKLLKKIIKIKPFFFSLPSSCSFQFWSSSISLRTCNSLVNASITSFSFITVLRSLILCLLVSNEKMIR